MGLELPHLPVSCEEAREAGVGDCGAQVIARHKGGNTGVWRKGGGATGQGAAGGRGSAPHPRGEAVPGGVTLEDETGGASVNGGHSLGVVTPEVRDLYVAVLGRDGVRADPLCTLVQDDGRVLSSHPGSGADLPATSL